MKKIVTLVLAIALLMTSVVAIAETKATPNVKTFAELKTKMNEKTHVWTLKFSKPVDKCWVLWTDKGEEPEEVAVGEDLTATVLTWSHKYMPGTKQIYGTNHATDVVTTTWIDNPAYDEATASEIKYKKDTKVAEGKRSGVVYYIDTVTKDDEWTIKEFDYKDAKGKIKSAYAVTGKTAEDDFGFLTDNIDYIKYKYAVEHPGQNLQVTAPSKVTVAQKGTNKWGETVENKVAVKQWADDEESIYVDGKIYGTTTVREYNPNANTVIATPDQAAIATLQGDFVVYYNRGGNIVGIETYEGQF
jgi:hypothetical protein